MRTSPFGKYFDFEMAIFDFCFHHEHVDSSSFIDIVLFSFIEILRVYLEYQGYSREYLIQWESCLSCKFK